MKAADILTLYRKAAPPLGWKPSTWISLLTLCDAGSKGMSLRELKLSIRTRTTPYSAHIRRWKKAALISETKVRAKGGKGGRMSRIFTATPKLYSFMQIEPPLEPINEPWTGLWDLECEAELRGMMDGLLKQGHKLAVYQLASDFQVGWRHQAATFEVWGMPLLTPQAAARDATARFWKALKQGRNAVFSHPCIAASALATALTHQPLALTQNTK